MKDQVEERACQVEVRDEKSPIDKGALYEKVQQSDKCRLRVSYMARLMESEQLR